MICNRPLLVEIIIEISKERAMSRATIIFSRLVALVDSAKRQRSLRLRPSQSYMIFTSSRLHRCRLNPVPSRTCRTREPRMRCGLPPLQSRFFEDAQGRGTAGAPPPGAKVRLSIAAEMAKSYPASRQCLRFWYVSTLPTPKTSLWGNVSTGTRPTANSATDRMAMDMAIPDRRARHQICTKPLSIGSN